MDRDNLPPFEGLRPEEEEDFKARGIAGVLRFDDGERIEVRKTADNAKEIRRVMAERRAERGKV